MIQILWADDEPWTIRAEIDKLEYLQFSVTVASSLSSALRALESHTKAAQTYELLVIDVINRRNRAGEEPDPRIPEVSTKRLGLRFAELVRNELRLPVPIVFYTVLDDPTASAYARSLGALYVLKQQAVADIIVGYVGAKDDG